MDDIDSIHALLAADIEDIELAEVRLKRGEPPEYVSGRVIDRWQNDITLRFRGKEHEVTNADEWSLVRYQPVAGEIEKNLIRNEMQ